MNGPSKEYAEALYLLGKEDNCLEEILSSTNLVLEVIEQNPEYVEFLASPTMPVKERLEAIDQAFLNNLNENVLYFLKLLVENGRIKNIVGIFEEFQNIFNLNKAKSFATIISAVELKSAEKNAILQKLITVTKREIEPTFITDKSIIGGLKIEVDGKVYDGSIKHTLNDVKEVITR